jgi:cell division septation protein DedD
VDTLPFAIQVGALSSLDAALAAADSLERRNARTIVAPIRLRGSRATYRLLVGPFANAAQAEVALRVLRAAGLVGTGVGGVVSVPLSLQLAAGLSRAAAEDARSKLRAAGVPTFLLGEADGTFAVYAGAYDAATQAALLEDLLTPTGSAGALVPRVGYLP